MEKYGRLRRKRDEWNRRRAAIGEHRGMVVGTAAHLDPEQLCSRRTATSKLHAVCPPQQAQTAPCAVCRFPQALQLPPSKESAGTQHIIHPCLTARVRAVQVDDRVDLRLQMKWDKPEPDWTNEQIFNLITLDGNAAMPADIAVTVSLIAPFDQEWRNW